MRLRALMGPYIDVFTIAPDPEKRAAEATIGRAPACEICLVHEAVSRRHATVRSNGPAWLIVDDASAAGTLLNGVRLEPSTSAVLNHGDLLRIGPWTFRVELEQDSHAPASAGSVLRTLDDVADAARKVERLPSHAQGIAVERLRLLTQCLTLLHNARREEDLARIALTHALKGTGCLRGAVLMPADAPGEVAVVHAEGFGHDGPPRFSRSLLAEAATGHTAVLSEAVQPVTTASIAELQVRAALCAPVTLSETVCAFLYLDARRGERASPTDVGPFCEAIARAYGLALSNLKRADLERRQQELTLQLHSARAVQQTIAPAPTGRVAHIRYAVHVQPGVFVAGDLFDVIPLDDGVAVLLGDVSGHGVGSGMLMAVTQAHLNAHLRSRGDVGEAIRSLNQYLCDHSAEGRFVSLWLGKIAPCGRVSFIDAGHGHWHIHRPRGAKCGSVHRGGIPLGIDPDARFEVDSTTIAEGDRLVLYSDGIVEQRNLSGETFGLERVLALRTDREPPDGFVNRVFAELQDFAARRTFDDDATIASIELVTPP
ncbi:MAG: SpoIIE family protein phosphatase [Phycisphaerales bacterium]